MDSESSLARRTPYAGTSFTGTKGENPSVVWSIHPVDAVGAFAERQCALWSNQLPRQGEPRMT